MSQIRNKKGQFQKGHLGYWTGKKRGLQSKETIRKRIETRKMNCSYKISNETKEKIRKKLKDLHNDPNSVYNTEDFRKRVSLNHRRHQTEETKKILSKLKKGVPLSEEHKLALRKPKSIKTKKPPMTEKTKEKMRQIMLRQWKDPIFREERIKAQLKGLMKRPTKYEQKVAQVCIRNNLPFIYTGDGRFLINFKNPDFVNKDEKIAIEVFYSYYKIRDYGSVENYKKYCKKKYNAAGWRVIFIDETQIDNKNWKENCLKEIQKWT